MGSGADKLVFLHIPKTAGTSFRALVEPRFPAGSFLQLDPGGAWADVARRHLD